MATNEAAEAAEAARAVRRAWRTGRLVLGAYLVTGTLLLCWIAVVNPMLIINASVPSIAVLLGILVPQVLLYRYRTSRGKELAEATRGIERYDLSSPDAYYYTSHGLEKLRIGSYRASKENRLRYGVGPAAVVAALADRLRLLVFLRYLVLMLAGGLVASAVASHVLNREPTARATATITQCEPYQTRHDGSGTGCLGTWTVAGKTYSAALWSTGNPSGTPQPAVGSTRTVTYNTRHPGMLGKQDTTGMATYAVLAGLAGFGLAFWNYPRDKPYRGELDAIAAGRAPATAARPPAPGKPPARDGRRPRKKHRH